MAGARYAADPPGASVAADLDGYTVLYHRSSRTTHILASPAPELLAALAEDPADVETLTARLAATHELAAEDGLAETLEARLDELAASGLVRALEEDFVHAEARRRGEEGAAA